MSIPPNNFSSDGRSRIVNQFVGSSSAVVSPGPKKKLSVNAHGLHDPKGKWIVEYDWATSNYYLYVSSDQYATVDSDDYIIADSKKLWEFLSVNDNNPKLAYLKDPDSERAWQYDASTNTIKLVALDKGNNKQIWEFA